MRRLAALLIVLAGNPQGEQATFRVHDRLDTNEIEETTSLYIDRELVRIIHLDATHPYEVVTIAVTGGSAPSYALCGSVTVRALDGNPETHEVDGSGILTDVAGRDFDAVAAQDFTLFFLTDITEGRLPADVRINRARSCAEPVS
jgi:hypothetical protein